MNEIIEQDIEEVKGALIQNASVAMKDKKFLSLQIELEDGRIWVIKPKNDKELNFGIVNANSFQAWT